MKTYVSKISVSQDWLQAEIPVIRSRRGPGILSLIPRLDILQASHKSSGAIGGSLRYALSWKHQSTYPLYSAKKSPCVSETEFVFRDSVTRRRTVFLPFRLHILLNFSWRVHTTAQWISMVQRPMCQLINPLATQYGGFTTGTPHIVHYLLFLISRWHFIIISYTAFRLKFLPYTPLTHCGRVTQICVFNTVKLGTSASSP